MENSLSIWRHVVGELVVLGLVCSLLESLRVLCSICDTVRTNTYTTHRDDTNTTSLTGTTHIQFRLRNIPQYKFFDGRMFPALGGHFACSHKHETVATGTKPSVVPDYARCEAETIERR